MPSSNAICNLFHALMWVVALVLFEGCHTSPEAIEVKDVRLPDSFQESQWMEV